MLTELFKLYLICIPFVFSVTVLMYRESIRSFPDNAIQDRLARNISLLVVTLLWLFVITGTVGVGLFFVTKDSMRKRAYH